MQPRKHENTKPKSTRPSFSWFRGFVVAFVLAVSTGGWACSRREAAPRARNLVLITIDTLRADHVGAYGYARAQTPALDELARTGVRFDRAYAAAPITLPSHATMLTGR